MVKTLNEVTNTQNVEAPEYVKVIIRDKSANILRSTLMKCGVFRDRGIPEEFNITDLYEAHFKIINPIENIFHYIGYMDGQPILFGGKRAQVEFVLICVCLDALDPIQYVDKAILKEIVNRISD